jgi:diguanylate cyclase (GGDEF)-like protein
LSSHASLYAPARSVVGSHPRSDRAAWIFDVGLAAILNTGRYDLGWYVGRIYGLLAASFVLGVLLVENSLQFARLIKFSGDLTAANRALERLSLQDGLTSLANRRHFDAQLTLQLASARRNGRTLALVMFDLDAFKDYNDCYGHLAGDDCMKQVAASLRTCCQRATDVAARIGGEEFALILPDTDLAGATLVAEAAREAVARLRIPHARSAIAPYVTISGGCAACGAGAYVTEDQLITAADESLYEAKRSGRNRIVAVSAPSHSAVSSSAGDAAQCPLTERAQ